ncbi:glycoside hydrolase family 2 TIM barrel-domain containing protein [Pedobacter glucosidilyticus]|uniref:glycoside hydrolase family 2 TIM barrel-domain containing protein n=1 Tax=Pedobacter glucosidilyticus TaxID=1122941 RepID=UPI0026E9B896|nr:glycoside hydrolase family 2 TIM barrel-domain containing protein [Pedobacter glucosidilyticus]
MRNTLKFILILSCYLFSHEIFAQTRIIKSINSNWLFHKGGLNGLPWDEKNENWTKISIPHSWNDKDVVDDEPGYYRGISWYSKTIDIPKDWKSKSIYLHFEGAAQVAEVFIDGKFVGKHIGSYTAFSFNIDQYLNDHDSVTKHQIHVKLDNSHHEDIAPLSADFTFFGGIYRDVYLKVVDKIHFDMDNVASNGIFISTPQVSKTSASLAIKGNLSNYTGQTEELIIHHTLLNANHEIVAKKSQKIKAFKDKKTSFSFLFENINNPHLWSTKNPYLYKVVSTIQTQKSGQVLDQLENPVGFRWFNFDADKGFFLNGEPLKLIGASRHQDYLNKANALSDALHTRDVQLLKAMGANFLRVAHYPQDPAILEACDRLGILTSVETPLVNRITETEAFANNAKQMHLEMIRQNYNHPSIIIWAYMNEIMLRPRYEKGSAAQDTYFNRVAQLAQELENLTLKEDQTRYTMIPNHGNFALYKKYKLTEIPKLVGWNLYQGWYGANLKGFDKFLDQHHQELPHKPLLVTEYGADSDTRIHSNSPERFDKSVEYATLYHDSYINAILERPFVSAAMIWNLAEFNAEERAEATPHMNTKGILTYNREPKDPYRYYQARLLKTPFVQIGSKEWNLRTGFADTDTSLTSTQNIQVFSNMPTIKLLLNGIHEFKEKTINGIATFKVPFKDGINTLLASVEHEKKMITDLLNIDFRLVNQNLRNPLIPFQQLNVSLGDKRIFHDNVNHEIWIPEQAYKTGSWGFVGGEIYKIPNNVRQSFGSDKDILGTNLDPIYQTQRIGLEAFRFDVPDGKYEVVLHFAELLSKKSKEELVYNLSSQKNTEEFKEREFDVFINDKKVMANFGTAFELIPETAVGEKFIIYAKDNKGIIVSFREIKNKSILNGIQIKRVF